MICDGYTKDRGVCFMVAGFHEERLDDSVRGSVHEET
jgi:hypothetical protein